MLDKDNKAFEDHRVEQITRWQNMAYKKQAYIVNPIIMTALVVIFAFVTLFKFFNYNTNILDPFRFNVLMGILIIFELVGMVLGMGLEGGEKKQKEGKED